MTEIIIEKYTEYGICYPKISLNIRTIPCATTGVILDQYNLGESVIYDQVVITDKYTWISWLSTSGRRVYMAIKDRITGERFGDCYDIPSSSTGTETIVQEYSENGICYPKMTMNIRDLPCASTGTILDQYFVGESVIYDYVVKTDKYVWISWLSRSGARRYMAVKDIATGERFGDCADVPNGLGESNTPTGVETIVNEYAESGICYPQMTTSIRTIPCATNGVVLDYYYVDESVIYDYVVITNKYVWISWTGASGRRVYMTVKDQITGERWGVCEDISGGSGSSGGSGGSGSGIGMPGVKKIFIDAGHGGSDPGASGNGLKEKDIVLSITQKLTSLFNAKGIQVSHSRYSDTSVGLAERAEIANSWGADLFISIHANALDGSGSAYGTECYTYPNSTAENKRLSADICSSISSNLGTYNRGHREADFAVLRLTNMPAVLIETAFIDNAEDANKLRTRQSEFAQAIFEAITGASSNPEPIPPKPSEAEQMIKDLVALAKKFHEHIGVTSNTEKINREVLDYLRVYKYSDTAWTAIIGGFSTIFEYVADNAPKLHEKIRPYIQGNELFDYKGHKLDLAHLAATTLGYSYGRLCPRFWTGWGADLASTMRDVQARKDNFPDSGTDEEVADFVLGNPKCKFSVEDIEADVDSIHFSGALKNNTLDILFEKYYSDGYNARKTLITSDINKVYSECNVDGAKSLSDKIFNIMISDQGFEFVGGAGGFALEWFARYELKMPDDSEKRAACNAFEKYIENKL